MALGCSLRSPCSSVSSSRPMMASRTGTGSSTNTLVVSGLSAYPASGQLGYSDNATPPSVETVAGGAESLSREGLTKSQVLVGRPAAPKVHPKVARQREPAGLLSPGILIFTDCWHSFHHSPTQRKMLQTQPGVTLLGVRHEPVHHWVYRSCEPDPHHLFRRRSLACL
jgi:hypothetical protein